MFVLNKSFTIDRHDYNRDFSDFFSSVKGRLKQYKNNPDIAIEIYKTDKSYGVKFTNITKNGGWLY